MSVEQLEEIADRIEAFCELETADKITFTILLKDRSGTVIRSNEEYIDVGRINRTNEWELESIRKAFIDAGKPIPEVYNYDFFSEADR